MRQHLTEQCTGPSLAAVGRPSKLACSDALRKGVLGPVTASVRQFKRGQSMRRRLATVVIMLATAISWRSTCQTEEFLKEAQVRKELYKPCKTWDEPPQLGETVVAAKFDTLTQSQLECLYGVMVKAVSNKSVGFNNALARAWACNPDWAPTIVPPRAVLRKNEDGSTWGFVRIELPKQKQKELAKILDTCNEKIAEHLERADVKTTWQVLIVPKVRTEGEKAK